MIEFNAAAGVGATTDTATRESSTSKNAPNPFDVFLREETESALVVKEGGEPMYFAHGANGRALENEYQRAFYAWAVERKPFTDPGQPKFTPHYPMKGQDGAWYQFNAGGDMVPWSNGDPEKYILENPKPDTSRPTLDQIIKLFKACEWAE